MFGRQELVGINCNKRSDMTFYLNKSDDLRVQLNHKKSIEKLGNNKHRLNLKSCLNVWLLTYTRDTKNFNTF